MASGRTATHALERFLAIVGVVICLIISLRVWQVVGDQQPMWPLPGLYLIEMVVLSVVATVGIARDVSRGGAVTWAVVGVLCAFVVIGAWSIGLLFLPVALIFAGAAILSDREQRRSSVKHAEIAIAAGLMQAVLMFIAIHLF